MDWFLCLLGITLLTTISVGVFVWFWKTDGIKNALILFGSALSGALFASGCVYLINTYCPNCF